MTPGWEYLRQRPSRYELRTTGLKKIPDQLVFGRDMIQPINHLVNWRLIRQRKQAQIDKDVIHENSTRVNHNYIIGDWAMVREKMTLNMKHH